MVKDKVKPSDQWLDIEPTAAEVQVGAIAKLKHRKHRAVVVVMRSARKLGSDVKISDLPKKLAAEFAKKSSANKIKDHGLIKIGSYQAAQVSFESSKNGEVQFNRTIVIPMQWQTFYFSLSTKTGEAKKIAEELPKLTLDLLKQAFAQ